MGLKLHYLNQIYHKIQLQLLELAPHAEYTDIAEATHMVVGDANDAFSAVILDFLKRNHSAQGAVT